MPTDRRSLLNGAATAGAAPIVGFRPDGAVAAEDAGEDDVEPGGRYPERLLPPDGRPQGAHRIEGRRDHRLASKPILQPRGIDSTSVERLADTHYALPAFSAGLTHARTPIPVLWSRSVGHTNAAFAMETLIDQAAEALQTDPVAFRPRLLAGGDADQRR